MVTENRRANVHQCLCRRCREHPRSKVARQHRSINRLLAASDERVRRLMAGFVAEQMGEGGIARLARITGLDRKTIAKGRKELHQPEFADTPRVRRTGAGRKCVEVQHPKS